MHNIPEYITGRKSEYPKVEDQLDMIYKDMKNGTTQWVDFITSVKDRYPKPTELDNKE